MTYTKNREGYLIPSLSLPNQPNPYLNRYARLRADALRPTDAGGHAADELQSNRTDSTADGGQDPARADADHPDAGLQNEPAGLDADGQQPEEAGGGSSPSDAVRSLTEAPAKAESEQSPSAFALPEFPPTLLPQLLAMETSSRVSNAEYLTFYNKNPLLIDRLRFVRESYKDIFTELLLADDQHELIAAIDPKKLPQVEEQLSFELPDGSPTSAENNRLEKDDFLTPEKQENVIRSALPVAEYNAPQMDDGSVITDEDHARRPRRFFEEGIRQRWSIMGLPKRCPRLG